MSHQLYKVNTNETVQVGKWKPVTLTVLSARPKDKFACVSTVLVASGKSRFYLNPLIVA